jgi:hypothetical protein
MVKGLTTMPYQLNGQDDQIKAGMVVVDASNNPVGVVTASHLHGDPSDATDGSLEPLSAENGNAPGQTNGSQFIPTIAGSYLGGEKLPELLYVRLQRTGFLRVEKSGLYSRTYYVTPDQITRVSRNRVKLSVLRETLLSY